MLTRFRMWLIETIARRDLGVVLNVVIKGGVQLPERALVCHNRFEV